MMRRLAAIVALDVVGYSRLMATDEDETWTAWSNLRALIEPPFVEGGSRIVKSTGDGLLIESPSAVEAVKAAVDVQALAQHWNAGRPSNRRLLLRIGVNVGDIIVADDGDVYGDGVNLAARLEGLAQPGGICLSDATYRQVVGRVDHVFTSLGEQHLKNIPEPVTVWTIGPSPGATPPLDGRRLPYAVLAIIGVVAAGVVLVGIFGGVSEDRPSEREGSPPDQTTPIDASASRNADPVLWSVTFPADIGLLIPASDAACDETLCRGTVFVSTTDGRIHGVELDGQSMWPTPFEAGDVAEMVATNDGVAFTVAGSRAIVVLDGSSGTVDWRALAPFESTQDHPEIAVSSDHVALAFGLGVALLDAPGRPAWAFPEMTRLTAETVTTDGRLLAVGDGRWIYALDAESGEQLWEIGPAEIAPTTWLLVQEFEIPSGTGRRFERRVWVTTSDDDLVLIDGTTGQRIWSVPVTAPPTAPALDLVHVLDVDGRLTALDTRTGAVAWTAEDLTIDGDVVRADSTVYVLSGGELVAVNARSGTEVARVAGDFTDARLAAVGDVVIVAEGEKLSAIRP